MVPGPRRPRNTCSGLVRRLWVVLTRTYGFGRQQLGAERRHHRREQRALVHGLLRGTFSGGVAAHDASFAGPIFPATPGLCFGFSKGGRSIIASSFLRKGESIHSSPVVLSG